MTRRETGYMQGALTAIFLIGYFWTLRDFLHGNVRTPIEWNDTLKSLLSVLTAGVLTILYFWFNRQRDNSPTEPPNA
jgi:hypothetical protein